MNQGGICVKSKELLGIMQYQCAFAGKEAEITDLCQDTREVAYHVMWIATADCIYESGQTLEHYMKEALQRGAAAVVLDLDRARKIFTAAGENRWILKKMCQRY